MDWRFMSPRVNRYYIDSADTGVDGEGPGVVGFAALATQHWQLHDSISQAVAK